MLNIIIALFCSLGVFLGTGSYLSDCIVESKHQLVFQGFFPHDSQITVFSENSKGERTEIENIEVQGKSPNVDQRFIVHLEGRTVDKLGFDIVAQHPVKPYDSVYLHFIEIVNSFTQDLYFPHSELKTYFLSDQYAKDEINRLDYDSVDGTISIVSKKITNPLNDVFTVVLPLLFALLTFLLLIKISVINLPAFQDMNSGRTMTQSTQFDAINGIRGLSALLVLFSHVAPGFTAIQMGLALLFVLSGFLLSKPFVLASSHIFKPGTIHGYIVKRLKRILPMYYFTIFIVYLVDFEFAVAARHFLFVEARGHLWAIPQILSFYMLLPLILLATSLIFKIHRVAPVILLIISMLLWDHFALFPNLFYNGSYHTPFMLDSFLLGVTIAYIQYGIIQPSERLQRMLTVHSFPISLAALVFTVLCLAWSAPIDPPAWIAPLIARFEVKCLMAATIILLAINTPHSMYAKIIGNSVFRSIGVIGFSFYLLQGLGIEMVLLFQQSVLGHEEMIRPSWTLTFSVLAVTYILSLFTYSYIERPFFGKARA